MSRLPGKKSSAWLWLILVLLILAHFLGLLTGLENMVGQVSRPIIRSLSNKNQSVANWLAGWREQKTCREQLVEAKSQNSQLTAQTISLASLTEENNELRQLLAFQKARKFKLVTANIVYRGQPGGLLAPSQTLIIDQGARQGIATDLAVIDQQGAIIGKIGQVKDESAEVLLVTNKNGRLAAATASSSQTIGVVRGDMGLTIRLEMVAQNELLQVGQEIITSGLEPAVPQNLLIGRVSQVNKENNALWQDAGLEPLADPNQLSFVSVVIP
jgi:rod shape-determining protein MreC